MSRISINGWDIEKPKVPRGMDVPKCPAHKIERLFLQVFISI
jgi:nitrogen fixation protein